MGDEGVEPLACRLTFLMATVLQAAVRNTTLRSMPSDIDTSGSRTHRSPRFELGRFSRLRTVPCFDISRAPPMGFEPTISTLTGWRALQAAPRGRSFASIESSRFPAALPILPGARCPPVIVASTLLGRECHPGCSHEPRSFPGSARSSVQYSDVSSSSARNVRYLLKRGFGSPPATPADSCRLDGKGHFLWDCCC
jgi:hypothetical protein